MAYSLATWSIIIGMVLLPFIISLLIRRFRKKVDIVKVQGKEIPLKKKNFVEEKIVDKELEILQGYDYFKDRVGFFVIFKKIREFFYKRFYHADLIGINMQLESGKFVEFLAVIHRRSFKFAGGRYIIDTELKYDRVNSKYYWLDYHETFALPIRRNIDISAVRAGVENSKSAKIAYLTNPHTLEEAFRTEVAQMILKTEGRKDALVLFILILNSVILIIIAWMLYDLKDKVAG